MKTTNHLIRTRTPAVVALLAFGLVATVASADTVNATYNSATDVPLTANGYTATGNTVNFTLNFAPDTGTDLMVVTNTALDFINGTFDNLTNGQPVPLSYGGTTYSFVANYYGGSGNDLVLHWAKGRLFAWGWDNYGQLGDNSSGTNRLQPVPVVATGALAGKTVVALAAGNGHSLALCSDGTLAAWGWNGYGQLGNNSTSDSHVPVAVNIASGVSALNGKRVVSIAAGWYHSLALCSDGTVAAWGYNDRGQIGDNTTNTATVPVAVNGEPGVSVLAGKVVVGIAAGARHSLGTCSDGTLAAWGQNSGGQLGENTRTDRYAPVAVNTNAGVSSLYGKTAVAIAGGWLHSLALCSDGTASAWGDNFYRQLGNNSNLPSYTPTGVSTNPGVSVLAGKVVVAIAAGFRHSLALCSDGTAASWGYNDDGELGDNTTAWRSAPVAVNTNAGVSALCGKTVAAMVAAYYHSLALCSDGTLAAWGDNSFGQLGNNMGGTNGAHSYVPVMVSTDPLAAGERFSLVASSCLAAHTLALVAAPPSPSMSVTGNSLSITNGDTTPSAVEGTDFGNLLVGIGSVARTFTIQDTGPAPLNLTGTPKVGLSGPQAADFTVTVQPSSPVASVTGSTTFQVTFAPSGIGTRTATLSITNDDATQSPYTFAIQGTGFGSLDATYTTGSDVPLTSREFIATGNTVNFTLNFAPAAGTDLIVVKNTGMGFINGTFDNLTNGQPVTLSYGGTTYNFFANYYGGSGNDLVLVWASNRAFGWGLDNNGQIGDNTGGTNRLLPVRVTATGVLAGKTVVALAAGTAHSLALCSDGTLAAWGTNNFGQLGDNSTTSHSVPVLVNTASGVSALYGKAVVAISAGLSNSLALCSDGTVAGWGCNYYGQLGDNSTTSRIVPVSVNTASGVSALYDKTVVGIAAAYGHSLALCSDGTLAAWGWNGYGQLGDNTSTTRTVPVAVKTATGSALSGKTVVAIAGGRYHSLALCSDGSLAAWGWSNYGQLGTNNHGTASLVPVAVNTNSGISALYGKAVVGIAAGEVHSMALCSDGTVAAWGGNMYGQLGDNSGTQRDAPAAVNTDSGVSALYGKTVLGIAVGADHSLALCSDGSLAAWGYNTYGQLGDNTKFARKVPVTVNATTLATNQLFTQVSSGPTAFHTLALVAAPPASPINVTGAQTLTNGSYQFAFTNTPGAFFGVLAATNPALSWSYWTPLDGLTEVAPGQFQFTDPQTTNSPQRYYRVRSP